MPGNNSTDVPWSTITREVCENNATPIISNKLILDQLFGKEFNLARAWASTFKEPSFPDPNTLIWVDQDNLTRAAQFLDVTKPKKTTSTKEQYLNFLKRTLRDQMERFELDDQLLEYVSFSKLAIEYLDVPIFEKDSPLTILAKLDFPLYLTTSPHRFIEAALQAAGKPFRTEVFSWNRNAMWEKLKDKINKDEYKPDLNHEETSDVRVVYHLHGIDDCPDSLVLTEDDHLQFLIQGRGDLQRPDITPSHVRTRLNRTLLLLLGYEPYAWELRVLLKGMIENYAMRSARSNSSYDDSYAIPIHIVSSEVENERNYRKYLERFFDRKAFYFIDREIECFLPNLWKQCELHRKMQQMTAHPSLSQALDDEDSAQPDPAMLVKH